MRPYSELMSNVIRGTYICAKGGDCKTLCPYYELDTPENDMSCTDFLHKDAERLLSIARKLDEMSEEV